MMSVWVVARFLESQLTYETKRIDSYTICYQIIEGNMSDHTNSFSIKEKTYKYYDLKSLDSEKMDRLPFTPKIF